MQVARSPRVLASLGLLVLAVACVSPGEESAPAAWIPLFDGGTLDGWTPKIVGHEAGRDPDGTFRVEDGLLTVAYPEDLERWDGRFGHLFHDLELSHYRLRVEYRFTGEQVPGAPGWAFANSGVMIHGQRPETMARDQGFPVSIEVQLLGGNGEDERPTANLCTPGTTVELDGAVDPRHCIESSSPTFHGDAWVTVEVEVHGSDSITHFVNGEPVMTYAAPRLDPGDPVGAALGDGEPRLLERGTISVQSESHPIQFRRIEVLPL